MYSLPFGYNARNKSRSRLVCITRSIVHALITTELNNQLNKIHMDSYTNMEVEPITSGTQAVWYVLGFFEILLALRLLLKLLGISASNIIYSVTSPLVSPFNNMFHVTNASGSVLEWTTLLAMLVFAAIGYGIIGLLLMTQSVGGARNNSARLSDF